jgi:hypothetical protein
VTPGDVTKALALNSPDNHTRYQRLRKMFDMAGCQGDSLQELHVAHEADPDLVCTMPGLLTPSGALDPRRIIVFARYDHYGSGSGTIDNWSGAAMLPLLFATIYPGYREHTIQLVATCGHEGLTAFLKTLNPRQKATVLALIDVRNIGMDKTRIAFLTSESQTDNTVAEGRGGAFGVADRSLNAMPIAPTRAPSISAGGLSPHDPRLQAMTAANTYTKLGVPPQSNPYLQSFMSAKPQGAKDEADAILESDIPGVVIHSVTKANAALPGSNKDSLDHIDQTAYYDTYYYTAVYMLILDHPQTALEPTKNPAAK